MKANFYKSFFYGITITLCLFLSTALYAGSLPVTDDTPPKPREESPDFVMDQSGSSSADDSHYADEWESQGSKSLSRATENSNSSLPEKKIEKPSVSKSEETAKSEAVTDELKESDLTKNSEYKNLKNDDQGKKESLDKTDPFEPPQ